MHNRFPQVLVVTASTTVANQLRADLEATQCLVTIADDVVTALERMRENCPDVLVVDAGLPDRRAKLFGRCVRSARETRDVYLISLLAADGNVGGEESVDDYLTQGYTPRDLQTCLRRGTRHLELLRRQRALERADRLLGSVTTEGLESVVSRLLSNCERRPESLACLLVDLASDEFVSNSPNRQQAEWFRTCAELLVGFFRVTDYVCRLNDSTLAILLPDCSEAEAMFRASSVAENLSALARELGRDQTRIAMGVAAIDLAMKPGALLEHAELALGAARQRGAQAVAASELQDCVPLVAGC